MYSSVKYVWQLPVKIVLDYNILSLSFSLSIYYINNESRSNFQFDFCKNNWSGLNAIFIV